MTAHDAVADCSVIGLPVEDWDDRRLAAVQLRFGASATGGVKTPKQIEFWVDLPRSTVGDVL